MPPWLPITLQIVMPVLAVVATAVINLKIRFAPSQDAAKQELQLLAFRIIQGISTLSLIGFLIYDIFFSNEPLTRFAVFSIAYSVSAPLVQLAFFIVSRIAKSIDRLSGYIKESIVMHSEQLTLT